MDEFAEIAKRMRELNLARDKPFEQPLDPDFHADLNAKLLKSVKPAPTPTPEPNYGAWC